jgi:hypothetical protein
LDILPIHKEPVICAEPWFAENFDEAARSGWLKCEDVFVTKRLNRVFRYKTPVVQRAKRIKLNHHLAVILRLKMTRQDNRKTDISLRVCPDADQKYLPDGLKFVILSGTGESLTEIRVISRTERIEHCLSRLGSGEEFGFRLEWEESSRLTAYFIV